ncbi:hypothetical protein VTK56DRAFT_7596 [Thermocarpiscus australiensis]
MARPPSVRGRSPGLERSVNRILGRHLPRVRFALPAEEEEEEDSAGDDGLLAETEPEVNRSRRRGPRPRRARDDDDDRDWKPRRSGARRPRPAPSSSPAAELPSGQDPAGGPDGHLPKRPRGRRPRVARPPLPSPSPPQLPHPESPSPEIPAPTLATPIAAQGTHASGQPGQEMGVVSAGPSVAAAGESVPPSRKRGHTAEVELDEHGQPVKKRRGRPPKNPGQPPRRPRAPTSRSGRPADPSSRMMSSEGAQMTRGEFERAYRRDEWRYHPGGQTGGGKIEIIATGVVWQFIDRPNANSNGTRRKRSEEEEAAAETAAATGSAAAAAETPASAGGETAQAPAQALAQPPSQAPTVPAERPLPRIRVVSGARRAGGGGQSSNDSANARHNGASSSRAGGSTTSTATNAPGQAQTAPAGQFDVVDQRLRALGMPTREEFASDDEFRRFVSGISFPTGPIDEADPFGVKSARGQGRGPRGPDEGEGGGALL